MLKLQAIGHLGKDAVVNQTQGGKNVINFSVAHTEKFKDAQGVAQSKTTWVECSYWTEKTGIAPYLKKGTQVYIEGQPEVHQYTKQDGTVGVSLKCRILTVQLLGSAQANGTGAAPAEGQPATASSAPAGGYTPAATDGPADDLPF